MALVITSLFSTANATAPDGLYCPRPLRVALFEYGVLYRSALRDGAGSRLLPDLPTRNVVLMNKKRRAEWIAPRRWRNQACAWALQRGMVDAVLSQPIAYHAYPASQ